MSGLAWHPGEDGVLAAMVGGLTVAVVDPRGWWSSSILGIMQPCAGLDDGQAKVEAAWSDWMAQAGLTWRAAA